MLATLAFNAWNIFWGLAFFGASIFVHEWGHFWAARKRGLRVERFSIGFGPKLLSWQRNGVEYCLSLFPLGGYVTIPQVAAMEAIEGAPGQSQALPEATYTDKMIVAVMGAVFNVMFACCIACFLWWAGVPSHPQETTRRIGYVEPFVELSANARVPGPAAAAGLKAGDEILSIDGSSVATFGDIRKAIMMGNGRGADGQPKVTLAIKRKDQMLQIDAYPVLLSINPISQDQIRILGILPQEPLVIGRVQPGGPAQLAGLEPKDRILAVNEQPVHAARGLYAALQGQMHSELTLVRKGEVLTRQVAIVQEPYTRPQLRLAWTQDTMAHSLTLSPHYGTEPLPPAMQQSQSHTLSDLVVYETQGLSLSPGTPVHAIGYSKPSSLQEAYTWLKNPSQAPLTLSLGHPPLTLSPVDASVELIPPLTHPSLGIWLEGPEFILIHEPPWRQLYRTVQTTAKSLHSLIHRNSDIHLSHLMGPPGIIRTLHHFAEADFRLLLWFVVLLNVNLAILNLLPIPVLDGGHMLFATLGKLLRRPIPMRWISPVQTTFMLAFLGLMLYVSVMDVQRWRGDQHLEEQRLKASLLYIQ